MIEYTIEGGEYPADLAKRMVETALRTGAKRGTINLGKGLKIKWKIRP